MKLENLVLDRAPRHQPRCKHTACLPIGAHFLVTRNDRDYRGSSVETRSAVEIIAQLKATARG